MFWAKQLVYKFSFGYNTEKYIGIKMYSRYRITSDGKVFSINYNNTGIEQEMKQGSKRGYKVVGLVCDDGKRRFIGVHRLVASEFIPNPDNKPEVNHINGDKSDNRVENLEWVTSTENQRHAFKTGLQKPHSCNMNGNYQGSVVIHAKFTDDIVLKIRYMYKDGISTKAISKMYNVGKNTIDYMVSKTAKVRTWKHVLYPY